MIFPNSPEAERAALASLLIEPAAVRAICAARGVSARWFYLPVHANAYEAMCGLLDDGRGLDFTTLTQALQDRCRLAPHEAAPFINELTIAVPSAANIGHYLETLREKFTRRSIIEYAQAAMKDAQEPGEDGIEIAGELHSAVGGLLHTKTTRPTHKEVLQSIVDEVREGLRSG